MSSARHGLSLLEVVVALMITMTVLATALPIAVALLREQKGLAAEILRGESFPLVHARLDHDFGSARSLGVAVQDEPSAILLTLTPRDPAAPTVVWKVGAALERQEVPADSAQPARSRTWKVDGSFVFLPVELGGGRCVFLWQAAGGSQEVLVFEAPRDEEELR